MKLTGKIKELNRSSIKEAADTLPAGMCYFSKSGVVKLCNRQMFRLYHIMAQSDLQTLAELRQALEKCDENTDVSRLPGRRQVYLFPDGKAWKYTENVVAARDGNTYTEALFSDVSELYEKQLELEEQIRKLKQMAAKIRELSKTATAAAKEREVLATKTRLHAQMGENLTVMRQTLFASSTKKAQDAAARAMRKTVRFLMADSEAAGMDTGFDEFMQTAANSGVTVYIDGTLPKRQEPHEVFVIAMRECLTNSVRHGEADELRITLREENGSWLCGITNNGTAPKGEIKPQGGLKNLQRHVENCGGEMRIGCAPAFSLTIMIPKGEEEKL